MAYAEDVKALAKLERARLIGLIIGLSMTAISLVTSLSLGLPRAITWAIVGGICIQEGRIVKRLGRDPASSWMRAGICALVVLIYFL